MSHSRLMGKTPRLMLCAVVVLLAFGFIMLTSASRVRAMARFGDPYYFVTRQGIWLVLGLAAAAIVARIDYHWYKTLAWCMFAAALIGLVLVFVPGIGIRRGGSSRWIGLGGMRFQPSEFAKFAVIALLAAWYDARPQRLGRFWQGAALPFGIVGIVAGLLFLEPDYGTAALVAATGVGIMFVGGVKFAYIGLLSLAGFCFSLLVIFQNPNRANRFMAFLFPEQHPHFAYQLVQSRDAFSLGGWSGAGLGESIQKHYYLPEAHTDFIFAIIGEELGLPATGAVVLLFLTVFLCGLRISACAPDRFGRLLGFGVALGIILQGAFNIAVVTGCMPTKGITLPFISYGGSSLLMSMIMVAVLVNIARHAAPDYADRHTRFVRGRELTAADI